MVGFNNVDGFLIAKMSLIVTTSIIGFKK